MQYTYTLQEINTAAAAFWQQYKQYRVFALHGQMGAGKTTFVHALCQHLNISSAVSSPTFSIINEYEGNNLVVYHIDLYRLQNEEEAIRAGIEDCLYSQHICLIEWPERIPLLFAEDTLHLYIESLNNTTRTLRVGNK
ncbi:MAG: tRNA (adenosine(37)-N6)-threonylcarbamoyltransferase complex ATPase subunit type 1 TsaE [Sphingobacteriales bacterium]|jgi:tRNA threonylcarbamoyladenosine biosynthesis protein TsaE|nr:MAG: tRNA (adenosine(37)-N6)-threonylcarbamoyltransferase complex ATPase subunit type 1 TsaE [Sphingobacteriales bacterium]